MSILDRLAFTIAQKNILQNIKKDFLMWNERDFEELYPKVFEEKYENKVLAKKVFEYYVDMHKKLQEKPNDYSSFEKVKYEARKYSFTTVEKEGFGLGSCPVASEGTRCCNLLTLDAVESCGFDCSYCSIQSFYNQNKVAFDKNFSEKLASLELIEMKHII